MNLPCLYSIQSLLHVTCFSFEHKFLNLDSYDRNPYLPNFQSSFFTNKILLWGIVRGEIALIYKNYNFCVTYFFYHNK